LPDNPAGSLPATSGIGALRWQTSLYRRDQDPGPNSAITESLILLATVHADIQPTYPSTFYGTMQVDTPVTHLIRIRWYDYVPTINVIMRSTERPSDNTIRTELFRVRRCKEIGGRKRFAELECELEHVETTVGETDIEREQKFAENAQTGGMWDDGTTTWDDGIHHWDETVTVARRERAMSGKTLAKLNGHAKKQ
jgi:hypothetical protein